MSKIFCSKRTSLLIAEPLRGSLFTGQTYGSHLQLHIMFVSDNVSSEIISLSTTGDLFLLAQCPHALEVIQVKFDKHLLVYVMLQKNGQLKICLCEFACLCAQNVRKEPHSP
jgi:hypothetical protein